MERLTGYEGDVDAAVAECDDARDVGEGTAGEGAVALGLEAEAGAEADAQLGPGLRRDDAPQRHVQVARAAAVVRHQLARHDGRVLQRQRRLDRLRERHALHLHRRQTGGPANTPGLSHHPFFNCPSGPTWNGWRQRKVQFHLNTFGLGWDLHVPR